MKRLVLNQNTTLDVLNEASLILKHGGSIVYPSDTVYGLGANAFDTTAIRKVFSIKKRRRDKSLPILLKNLAWAEKVAFIYQREKTILERIWPGQITAILPKRKIIPEIITAGNPNVALRVADHRFLDLLLERLSLPITGTSANISGDQPSRKVSDIIKYFQNQIFKPDIIIDAGDLMHTEPSTILDLSTAKPKILRVGMTKPETLLKLLEA